MNLETLCIFPGALKVPAGVKRHNCGAGLEAWLPSPWWTEPQVLSSPVGSHYDHLLGGGVLGEISGPLHPVAVPVNPTHAPECPALPAAELAVKEPICSCYLLAHMPFMAPYCSE